MSQPVGRPVRVTSLSFTPGRSLEEIVSLAAREAALGCDLLALPETWRGQGRGTMEAPNGPTITAMAEVARSNQCYIVCPIDRWDGQRRYNTSVLLGRSGQIAGTYDKLYPYWSELDLEPAVAPGKTVTVIETDFGKVGLAICFDVNFANIWQALADAGAELVIWSSAYSAGSTLQSHALQHHYYIVSSTCESDCLVYDITGRVLLDEARPGLNISRVTLDLDRGIYHQNFNEQKCNRMLSEHPGEVAVELEMKREQWFTLRALAPGISARDLARAYGLEELRAYIARSRRALDDLRDGMFCVPSAH